MGRREGEGEGGRGREGEGEEAETLAAARCVWASVFLSCRQLAVITEGGRVPSSQAVDLALTHIREHIYTHILYMCPSLLFVLQIQGSRTLNFGFEVPNFLCSQK